MSQTEDIVRRMRELHQWFEADRWPQTRMHQASISLAANEAADEIERLREAVRVLAAIHTQWVRRHVAMDEAGAPPYPWDALAIAIDRAKSSPTALAAIEEARAG